jgi:hypothetical protein
VEAEGRNELERLVGREPVRKAYNMSMACHRVEVEKLLNEWADNHKEGGNLINCLVEWMHDDLYYLEDNVRQSDRRRIAEIAARLAPNAQAKGPGGSLPGPA